MLPDCERCRKPIMFYMHQRWDALRNMMRYWHPECCPDCPEGVTIHEGKSNETGD